MSKTEALVSVVVPVYQVAEYVGECLDSILSQKYKNVEIIVVDDGSTDGSGKICDEYAEKHHNIRVIHQQNAGLSAARNKGLAAAKGEFVCFIDSDDYIQPGYLAKMIQKMIDDESDICVCGFGEFLPPEQTMTGTNATIRLLLEQLNLDIVAWNKMYRRSLFIDYNIIYPDNKVHEDNLTTYKLYSHAKKVSYLAKSLYYYRVRENSIMDKTKYDTHLKMREQAAKEAQRYLAANKDLKQAADVSLLTAKFAYMDKSIAGLIDKKHFEEARDWVLLHCDDYKNNHFLTKKLKLYISLLKKLDGKPYIVFRKIKHE